METSDPAVPRCYRCRMCSYQDFIVLGRGLCELLQFKNIGRPISFIYNCFHTLPFRVALLRSFWPGSAGGIHRQPPTMPLASARSRAPARATTIAQLMDPLEYSRYARQLVAARPELREELERAKDSGWTREAMQAFLRERGGGDEGALHSGLRRLRQRVLLRTMARDLSGRAGLDEVCGTMSALAEVAIETSLEFLERSGQAAGVSEPRP